MVILMTKQTFIEWYQQNKSNTNWSRILKCSYPIMFEQILKSPGIKNSEKAFNFINGNTSIPKCICGKELKWYKSYAQRCSIVCANKATAKIRANTIANKSLDEKLKIKQKQKITNVIKYGENYAASRAMKRSKETIIKTETARKNAMMKKYGTYNLMHVDSIKQKAKNSFKFRTVEQKLKTANKIRSTRIKNGSCIDDHDERMFLSFKKYRRRVRYLTNKTIKTNHELFSNRGKTFHVDHKVSVLYGYKNKIPPNIIANINNLELKHFVDNIRKGFKNSISIDELYQLIDVMTSSE